VVLHDRSGDCMITRVPSSAGPEGWFPGPFILRARGRQAPFSPIRGSQGQL
jgi:hypothetical protein